MQRKLSCRKWWKLHLPDRRWNSQIVWRRPGFPKIHFDTGSTPERRGAQRWSSRRIGRGWTITHHDGRQWSPKRLLVDRKGITFIVITLNEEWRSMCRRKSYSQYNCDTWRDDTNAIKKTWPFVARNLVGHVKNSSTKRKAAMGHRETEARQCAKVERHLFLLIQKILYSKKSWKTRVGIANGSSHALSGQESDNRKSKHACILEAHETARKRLERTLSKKCHEDHIVHTFISQAMKIPDAKSGVDKEWKKLETIPAWQLDKVKNKKEVILEAPRDKIKVHSATLMAICHLKTSELKPKLQKYEGRVVLRGGIAKDDSWANAVFTKQGQFASPITAAKKVMDVIAKLNQTVMDKQHTQSQLIPKSKMEDAPKLVKISESECPDMWIRLPRHKWPNFFQTSKTLWFLLKEKKTDMYFVVSCEKDSSRKFYWNLDGQKYQVGSVCLFIESKVILIGTRG